MAEVVVAIGILALMLTMAGEVLHLTVTATGRAQALTEVHQALRAFEQTLRSDLAAIDRDRTVMLIHAAPINAYWTRAQKEADDDNNPSAYPHDDDPEREVPAHPDLLQPPRADILMFFTSRKEVTNYVRYQYDSPGVSPELGHGVSSSLQQVVYGHAELGEYVPIKPKPLKGDTHVFEPDLTQDPGLTMFPDITSANNIASVPAQDWHLARRSIVLMPFPPPATVSGTPAWADWDYGMGATTTGGEWLFNSAAILEGRTDVVGSFDYDQTMLTYPTSGAPYERCALPGVFPLQDDLNPGELPVARSRLDPTPPPQYANRLGHYFLPHCASFKVEWALDPDSDFVGGRLDGERKVLWFDPGWVDVMDPPSPPDEPGEGPLGSLTAAIDEEESKNALTPRLERLSALYAQALGKDKNNAVYSLQQRYDGTDMFWNSCGYGDGARSNMAFFSSTGHDPTGEQLIREDIFPIALRVTVDLFDDENRLERPIRHVIVARVGG